MKETFYFSHDYGSRADSKIKRLIYKHGMEGYGVYWCIIEDLYQNDNKLNRDYEMYSYYLSCTTTLYESIVEDFDLFVLEDNTFSSISIQRRLDKRLEKSNVAREKANKRWNKEQPALLEHNDSIASKVKKSKEDNIIIDNKKLLEVFNSILGKNARVVPEKAKKQLRDRIKEGYTKDDIVLALKNASKDQHHIETRYKYLTLEFITRPDKLERFVNMSDFKIKRKHI
jgi:hypothetical protein